MHKSALVLTCLACVGFGRRMQVPVGLESRSAEPARKNALTDLAMLLLAANPEAAFNPSGTLLSGTHSVASDASTRIGHHPRMSLGENTGLSHKQHQLSRAQVLGGLAAAAAMPILPVFADATPATMREAYTRYVPRIERGRDFWGDRLKGLIDAKKWDIIKRELEPIGKKDTGGSIKKFFPPLKLWASSFSGKGVSEKTSAMLDAVDELKEAVQSLEVAANGKLEDSGLFAFLTGPKTMDEPSRLKLANTAWLKGKSAINKYILIGNDALVNLEPLDKIE